MESPIYLALFVVLYCALGPGLVTGQVCEDLDTTACILLQNTKPDLCQVPSLADTACKRFCGHCPLTCYNCPNPTNTTNGCTTTMACPSNQTCMLKTLNAHDGHHEYIATCEDKQICDGFGFGFGSGLVGKRHAQKRSVSVKCCHSDLCNSPTFTTTTALPTSPPTSPIPVHNCQSDIVFVLDESGSIGMTAFKEMVSFVQKTVTGLDIGPHGDQVGLLVYDKTPHLQWNLNEYPTKADILGALTYVPYHDGSTHTELALRYVRTDMLTYAAGDRRSANDVVVVVTDGRSSNHQQTAVESTLLHQQSSNVIAIGVGQSITHTEVQEIATNRGHALYVRNYSDLDGLAAKVVSLICGIV